jgi:hypothetical protein
MLTPCIICGADLEPAMPDTVQQPSGGTAFTTRGHYGSTVFDPLNLPEQLSIVVCDECLVGSAQGGRVLHAVDGEEATKWSGNG